MLRGEQFTSIAMARGYVRAKLGGFDRRQRFMRHVRTTRALSHADLIRIVRLAHACSPLLRAAALRNLVAATPIEVTYGHCYAVRRRLVRMHYRL